jgi:hypothetical protein
LPEGRFGPVEAAEQPVADDQGIDKQMHSGRRVSQYVSV